MAHVQWTAPSPFWKRPRDLSDADRLAMRQPAILRFASDAFMEEYTRALDTNPAKLPSLEAQYETWRTPGSSTPAVPVPARSLSSLQQKVARTKLNAERKLAMFSSGGVALAEPPAASDTGASLDSGTAKTLKLYQPAHQRFYLVTAGLVCRVPGLPDHTINPSLQEKATFVVRRVRTLTDSTTGQTARAEYGFIPGQGGGSWLRVASPETALAPAEERLPLFAVNFADDAGKKRRVLSGLIPVGRREAYVGASEQTAVSTPPPPAADPGTGDAVDPGAPPPPIDPRIALLSADVIEPWKALVLSAARTAERVTDPNNLGQATAVTIRDASRENIQVGSWYVLLDFATFLDQQVHDVWVALQNGTTPADPKQQAVVTAIRGATRPSTDAKGLKTPATLADALVAVAAFSAALEKADGAFKLAGPNTGWPDFSFVLADSTELGILTSAQPAVTLPSSTPFGLTTAQTMLRRISVLRGLIADALPAQNEHPVPDLPLAAFPVMAPDEPIRFVIRCVFERPECTPINPVILSDPTREFALASFFDTDAPARPIRIALPVDTSPAGLRRAPKNTAFMVSDILCGQINRAKGMGFVDLVLSVLPFPFTKGLDSSAPTACKTDAGLSLGMICSLSIPIITICALIVLIIMVSLLDIIFRWMPFFFFCFPFPKFSAKSAQP